MLMWRETSFYKKIMCLPNVELIHPSLNPQELLKKSRLVITIAGTVGLEAIFQNKPVIVASDVIYSSMPSVFRLENIEELPELIRQAINSITPNHGQRKLIELLESQGLPIDMIELQHDCMRYISGQGVNELVKPDEKKLREFIEFRKDDLNVIADRHIQKMNLYDGNNIIFGKKRDPITFS